MTSFADAAALPASEARGLAVSRPPEGAVEQALLSLLPVKERAEVERLATELVAEVAGARWAALYHAADGAFELRAAHPLPGPEVPQTLLLQSEGLECAAEDPVLSGLALGPADLHLVLPLDLGEDGWALLLLGSHGGGMTYGADHLAVLRRVVECAGVALRNAHLVERLRSLVFVDALTGCYNRRGMEEHLRVEMVRARRYRRPLSLLLLDLDHFKRINDVLGHTMGDYALRRVGEMLQREFRVTDLACRYGGDEFVVIFPETPKHEVMRLAERLRARIAALLPDERFPDALTVSLGVAAYPDDAAEPEDLVSLADRALYLAKADGRNRVISA